MNLLRVGQLKCDVSTEGRQIIMSEIIKTLPFPQRNIQITQSVAKSHRFLSNMIPKSLLYSNLCNNMGMKNAEIFTSLLESVEPSYFVSWHLVVVVSSLGL